MSLKAFHIFFITVSALFLAGFGAWSVNAYAHAGGGVNLLFAALGFAGAVGLPIYGVWFLKKTKGVGLV
jgi:hypothetical protein